MTRPGTGLVVLGVHRSGTSAVTGLLHLCGVRVGEQHELTDANIENPRGFWERRDLRRICDALLHSAGADWWKVANFDTEAIPHAVLTEQRMAFARVVSILNSHGPWVIKEPRLCLLVSLLRDHIRNPICIHVFRDPLEVARSLQRRNGFSIAGGIALWEIYNRWALDGTSTLPRVAVDYESLMTRPMETLGALTNRLEDLGIGSLEVPDEDRVGEFVDSLLYRHRAARNETGKYLSGPQRKLWRRMRSGEVFDLKCDKSISDVSRQNLQDLESTKRSLDHHRESSEYYKDRSQALEGKLQVHKKKAAAVGRERVRHLRETVTAREAELVGKSRELAFRNRELALRRSELAVASRSLAAHDRRIRDLLGSTSWRITAPLRFLSQGVRTARRSCARASKSVRSAVRRRRRALASRSTPSPVSQGREDVDWDGLADLIQACRRNDVRDGEAREQAGLSDRGRSTKVSVIAWNLTHNALGRAYLLADVLRQDFDVEIVGPEFSQFGEDIWGPLRSCSRVTIKSFPGEDFPGYFRRMEDVAKQIDGDVLYVSKPRLPGLELGILAKLDRNRPIVLDIDDYELGFFGNTAPLMLHELKAREGRRDFFRPHAESWTRYCDSLVPLFEQLTVSNDELGKRYQGVVLPHLRNERDFHPAAYPRSRIRARLGFGPGDRVVLFAGTLRMHKGVGEVVDALMELNRPRYKLMIVGSPPDEETARFVESLQYPWITVVPDVPFHDLPGYVCVGDLVCLLQDAKSVVSSYQIPAKLTDALAMGIPVIARDAPPLATFAEEGLVELLGDAPLSERIDEIFRNHDVYKARARENREKFLLKYSYGACRPWLRKMINRLAGKPEPVPDEFHELVEYHRAMFGGAAEAGGTIAQVLRTRSVEVMAGAGLVNGKAPSLAPRAVNQRPFVDDRIDFVFFWKQNDTGIYGRRQDMLVKYLERDSRVNRILHFDAPVSLLGSTRDAVKSGHVGRHSHSGLILWRIIRKKLRLDDTEKVRFDVFVYLTLRRAGRIVGRLVPALSGYPDYLHGVLERFGTGRRRTVFWVCPANRHFPRIEERFQPDLVVADVIDDQRKWRVSDRRRDELSRNYREILGRSHVVLANCDSVFHSMRKFSENIHLIPNAAEDLEEEARSWSMPRELRRLKGPIVGYVGNLDVARIDVDLLMKIASSRPDWNLVLIGSMHKGWELGALRPFENVHFMGVRVHDEAVRFVRFFDVAIIPHLDNPLTQNMNPLKLYVYFSLHVPVVTTPIANTDDFAEFTRVGHTAEEFIAEIGHCLENSPIDEGRERLRELLKVHSWQARVSRVMALIESEFGRDGTCDACDGAAEEGDDAGGDDDAAGDDGPVAVVQGRDYRDGCSICGHRGSFRHDDAVSSTRENYKCEGCGGSLRYREQGRVIVDRFSREGSGHLADLVNETEFRSLRVYEPGMIGPFRRVFRKLPNYRTSYFWPDVPKGEFHEDVQCQDLTDLTYDDGSFDLVLSSDIFEHVRKPFDGFKEIDRVLKPGGFHVFSIPVDFPMPSKTVFRVDTSGPEDIFTLPAHYHGAPMGGRSLVYTDFGADMVEMMSRQGIDLKMDVLSSADCPAEVRNRVVTFYWQKKA